VRCLRRFVLHLVALKTLMSASDEVEPAPDEKGRMFAVERRRPATICMSERHICRLASPLLISLLLCNRLLRLCSADTNRSSFRLPSFVGFTN